MASRFNIIKDMILQYIIRTLIPRLPFLKRFIKKESASLILESLSLVEKQEERVIDNASLKDHIRSVKLGLRFLETSLNISSNEDLKMRIESVLYDVSLELRSLCNRRADGSLILDLNCAYTDLREKMKNVIIEPETGEYDVVFPNIFERKRDFEEINNFLVQSFGDLSSCNADLFSPLRNEIGDVKDKLILLQPLLTYVADTRVHIEEDKEELLTPLILLLEEAVCVLYSCLIDIRDEETATTTKHKLSHLLKKIEVKEIYIAVLRATNLWKSPNNPRKNELHLLDNLTQLLDSNASYVTLNNLSEKLHDELKFLDNFVTALPHEQRLEKFNYVVSSVEDITRTALPILYSCRDQDMNEDIAREVNGALSQVVGQIKHIQVEVREIKLHCYPKTDELGFLDLFLGHLEELQNFCPELIETLKDEIDILRVEFDYLRSFLKKIKQQHNEHEELKDVWTRIIHLAYQAEYLVDLFLVKEAFDSRIMLSLSKIIELTKTIKAEVMIMDDKEKFHTQSGHVTKTPIHVLSKATDIAIDEVVGVKDEAEKIMGYLVGNNVKNLDVVSIVGMPGLGKTTLAKKMYESPSIVQCFDVRAWCSVSQTYRKSELLVTLLSGVSGVTHGNEGLDEHTLAKKLFQSLKGRRYLIVLDDMWDIKAWHDLKRCFPDDKEGSRILITSRLWEVVSQIKRDGKVHALRLFYHDESWELFQKKLSLQEGLSEEILNVGRQIVQNCKGLPLAIVVIAGLLAKVEKSIDKWKEVAVSLNSVVLNDSESRCKAIFELSYNHLPDDLKSCFLYLGTFAEDAEIPVWKLKWLWIAEGFVRNTEGKSLEDLVEVYFLDLIKRSLVVATKERSLGGVKECLVHDLLRDFCLEKAKEERFLQLVHESHSSIATVYDQRRVSIYATASSLQKVKPFGCTVRSLLYKANRGSIHSYDFSFIIQNFKLLKVLDLANLNSGQSFSKILLLIHLRYLVVAVQTMFIPSSIANLWNLQFFCVEFYGSDDYDNYLVQVPNSLWNMGNLRHVVIKHRAFFHVDHNKLELDNLETFSTPCLSYGEGAENLLRRLPKLRKLRCAVKESWDDATDCYQFPVLDFLDQLMSLKVIFERSLYQGMECEFKFPSNLQKLTLLKYLPSWDDISRIGRMLPNLRVLKLIGYDWDEKWIVNDGDFPQLKYLKLSFMNCLHDWDIASEDSFPNLEQLVLEDCQHLEEIPPCFVEIATLQMISVKYCKPSVEKSARRIQKEQQEEMGNELKVYIYPRDDIYIVDEHVEYGNGPLVLMDY